MNNNERDKYAILFLTKNHLFMKKLILFFGLSFSFLCSNAQVVKINGNKVEVYNDNGSYVCGKTFDNLEDAVGGDGIIAILHTSGEVEVRDSKLEYISGKRFDNVKSIRTSGSNVVIYYTNGKAEVRDSRMTYISSR